MSKNNILVKFGDKLRKERLKRNLSQEKLAEMAGLARNYIGMIERAERSVSLKNLDMLAKALDLTLNKLLDL